jgi:hypothetical protein
LTTGHFTTEKDIAVPVDAVIRRRIVFAVVALALLVGRPQDAWAAKEQDWWGWLEEFSGPGPFKGWELSLEVLCINLADRRSVPQAELAKVQAVQEAAKPVAAAFKAFDDSARDAKRNLRVLTIDEQQTLLRLRHRLTGTAEKKDPSLPDLDKSLDSLAASLKLQTELKNLRDAVETKKQVMGSPNVLLPMLAAVSPLGGDVAKARSSRQFKLVGWSEKFPFASCRGGQGAIEKDREEDRRRSAELMATAGVLEALGLNTTEKEAKPDAEARARKTDIVQSRRDWQTGIVISRGWYRSLENQLFDPDATDANEPQVNVAPIEFLAHSKLSSSIDIGAGLGVALFRTERAGNPEAYPKFDESNLESKSFYLVPLSVVVRPGRLFTNSRWASILGYRMSLRYFGDLDTTNFALKPPLTNQTPSYTQKGEFVWGAAAFIDGVAAVELLGDLFR